uniref:Uncharacterized protein LOC113795227 n=1 Tax=Dermatophagoides pteronyssinus TaxID=6956 RepID=A0A6P6Y726_DERPT|nr:uncharacterized protein LOC113795227 [Dermatophagoides pteronyssinus]
MSNGLNDLIPENIAEGIMSIIQWIGNESRINNEKPIISISMSINKMNGKIHIYCLKSYDQFTYIVGDYNQEISVNEMQTFYITNNKMKHIMGIIVISTLVLGPLLILLAILYCKKDSSTTAKTKSKLQNYYLRITSKTSLPITSESISVKETTTKKRSKSPKKNRSKSPKKRSKSPKKRSKSPKERSKSPKERSKSPKKRSKSPKNESESPTES